MTTVRFPLRVRKVQRIQPTCEAVYFDGTRECMESIVEWGAGKLRTYNHRLYSRVSLSSPGGAIVLLTKGGPGWIVKEADALFTYFPSSNRDFWTIFKDKEIVS